MGWPTGTPAHAHATQETELQKPIPRVLEQIAQEVASEPVCVMARESWDENWQFGDDWREAS